MSMLREARVDRRGILFVVSAPSGAGKTTLTRSTFEAFPDLSPSVSCTTRRPRIGEVDGRDYFFVEPVEFDRRRDGGDVAQIVLGAQSNVQDGAVVHVADDLPAIIGRLVTVGHKAIVHACTVEDEVLVGMGAIILDGARVGTRSIIGANATVKQGMEIPPGSLVLGTPAKIVRTLSAEEQDEIKVWALRYVRLSREYLKVRG